jgi:hypothetical protein
MFFRTLMLTAASAMMIMAPASAQDDQVAPPPADCQATTAPDSNQGNNTMPSVDPTHTGSLFVDKLTPCDGVLRPPATGDEMTQPPPDTGPIREIEPGQLPDQQSNPQQQ